MLIFVVPVTITDLASVRFTVCHSDITLETYILFYSKFIQGPCKSTSIGLDQVVEGKKVRDDHIFLDVHESICRRSTKARKNFHHLKTHLFQEVRHSGSLRDCDSITVTLTCPVTICDCEHFRFLLCLLSLSNCTSVLLLASPLFVSLPVRQETSLHVRVLAHAHFFIAGLCRTFFHTFAFALFVLLVINCLVFIVGVLELEFVIVWGVVIFRSGFEIVLAVFKVIVVAINLEREQCTVLTLALLLSFLAFLAFCVFGARGDAIGGL
mmetsp:Transcript_2171/g.5005  ORF Transcript_2171/g.5005 Transcript_2171/m.5005 type:complete len:267 (-) Transcript_2171:389-1189(-)